MTDPPPPADGLQLRRATPLPPLAHFGLIALDMDSTLITIECIDEIAAAVGLKAQVAAITEATMRGEIADFRESLLRRVALLKGVPEGALQEVYDTRLQLTPGAEQLLEACKAAGLKTLLVSGGFTFFAERLRARLGLDFVRSNRLEVVDGALTGRVLPQAWGGFWVGGGQARDAAGCGLAAGPGPGAHDRGGRWLQRHPDDAGRGPVGGLPRQAARAQGGGGVDRHGRTGTAAGRLGVTRSRARCRGWRGSRPGCRAFPHERGKGAAKPIRPDGRRWSCAGS